MSPIKTFADQFRERGVRKTLTIYMSSALTAIGIVRLFSEVYGLSPAIFPAVVTFLTFGLVSAFVFAWLHGKEGTQRFGKKEIVFHCTLLAVALVVSFRIGGASRPAFPPVDNGGVPSVAILYLKNLGSEADEPYSYGITQDLIVDIAKAGLVRVAPMKDVLSLQNSTMPIDSIALRLRVQYVLDGSIKRIGDLLQLSGQIVEVTTGATLWADRLQTTLRDAPALQGQLARAIIRALRLEPSEAVMNDITTSRTTNPEAYEFYLRAKYLFEKKKTKADVETARGMYQKAIDLDSGFASAYTGKGTTYTSQGEYDEAEHIYMRALQIARQSNDKNEEAAALSLLGVVEWYRGNQSKALEYYSQSSTIASEIGDRAGEGRTMNNIAVVYSAQGNYGKALDYYANSLQRARELGDRRAEGNALSNMGNIHYLQGDYGRAMDDYTQTLNMFQELGDRRGEGMTLNSLGSIYRSQGDYDRALEYYTRSLRVKQDLGDPRGEAFTLNDIGTVYDARGNYSEALDHYSQSLAISQGLDDQDGQGYALLGIGVVYHKQGLYGKATEFLKKAGALFARTDEKPGRISTLSWLALTEARNKNPKDAQAYVDSIEVLLTVVPKPEDYIGVSRNLHEVYSLFGNQERAAEYLERAYKELMLRAERISDEPMRRSYLTNVKLNREVAAEWHNQKPTAEKK